MNCNFDLDDSNTFHSPDDETLTNDINGIMLRDTQIERNVLWAETDVALIFFHPNTAVSDVGLLTFGPNVCCKFMPGTKLSVAYGSSGISNPQETGVVFTSFRDDTRKGDTNGDGSVSSPATGDWEGVRIVSEWADWTNIFYAAN